jgi:hypothetical protein
MLKTILLIPILSLAVSGANDSAKVTTKCNVLRAVNVDAISNYEFATIGKMIKSQDSNFKSISFYEVDYEYSQDSVLFVLDYDGDILGEVQSWFIKSTGKVYIQGANLEQFSEGKLIVSVDYTINQKTCRQEFQL